MTTAVLETGAVCIAGVALHRRHRKRYDAGGPARRAPPRSGASLANHADLRPDSAPQYGPPLSPPDGANKPIISLLVECGWATAWRSYGWADTVIPLGR